MTNAANVWGFCLVAALLGTAIGAFFATRQKRLTVAALGAVVASLPILPEGVSLAHCVFAFWDVPSLTGAAFAIYFGLWRRRSGERGVGLDGVRSDANEENDVAKRETMFFALALIVFGVALYASEMNFFTFDVYRWGYARIVGLTTACVAAAFCSRRVAALVVGAYVATSVGFYANFFDAMLDVGFFGGLTVVALIELTKTGVRRRKAALSTSERSREFAPLRVEEKSESDVESASLKNLRLTLRK